MKYKRPPLKILDDKWDEATECKTMRRARALIESHAFIVSNRNRYLADENGRLVRLPSPPPLPPWIYRIAKFDYEHSG